MAMKDLRLIAVASFAILTACGSPSDVSSSKASSAARPACGVTPACTAAAPTLGKKEGFLSSNPKGSSYHFGKDFYFNESEDQWIIAKFQYGNYFLRSPLIHEAVEIQLLRDCGSKWEVLAQSLTSQAGENPTTLDMQDNGGMIFFKIPATKRLELGRHKIRIVVKGDNSTVDLFIEVLPQNSALFVSDVDGTLTKGELSEGIASIFNTLPPLNPGAPELYQSLAHKGYRPLYLTARSSNLVQRTRDFVSSNKFPEGIISTSSAGTLGLSGDKAIQYKSKFLADLQNRGFKIAYGFGNTAVDAQTFENASIDEGSRYFFQYSDFSNFGGGSAFSHYSDLDQVANAENLCQ